MSKQTVFLVGATGETGTAVLDALINDKSFDVKCFVRTSSADKDSTQQLRDRGLKVILGDLSSPVDEIVGLLDGIDTVVSCIFPHSVREQIPLIDASVRAGVKRFVPCNFATPAARGGVMTIRDQKEEVHDHMFRSRLPYTIIDVGFWYQMSFPGVPSGRFQYATAVGIDEVYAGGSAPNMLIDKRDIGLITAQAIKDPRTLNKRLFTYGEVLSQNEIHKIIEEKTGEKLELPEKSAEEMYALEAAATAAWKADQGNLMKKYAMTLTQYAVTKFARADNTPENAEYLGYLNGRELYPDLKYIGFSEFVDELVAGKAERPYGALFQPSTENNDRKALLSAIKQ